MSSSIYVMAILASLLVPQTILATEAWWPVNDSTIAGTWQAVDYAHGHVFRLEIRDRTATLAIADKLASSDLMFLSKKISVKEGRVSFVGTEHGKELSIQVDGEGRADDCGVLKLSMRVREQKRLHAYWDGVMLEFVKECIRAPTLHALLASEARAKAIIGSQKNSDSERGEATPPQPPKRNGKARGE